MKKQPKPLVINKELITYVTACLSSQVLFYALDSLKTSNSVYYKEKVKIKANELIPVMIQTLGKDVQKLFSNEEIQTMEMIRAIERIAKLIAEGNGEALTIIDQMMQKDFDFSKYKLVEI